MWGIHLLALVCVSIAIGMGVWQYDAWTARRAAERVDLTQAEPVPLTDVLGPDDPFPRDGLGRPVTIEGTFLDAGTVLIADRDDAAGKVGRWLVTPISVGASDAPAIPVVRGWVRADSDVADLPKPPTGKVDVEGWLQPSEMGNDPDDDPDDRVLPALRVADLVQLLDGQDMYGGYVVAEQPTSTDATAGVVAADLDQLPPVSRFTGLRNILYAIEWWLFAAFAAFIWWRHVRETTREQPNTGAAEESDVDGVVGSQT
ncbi:MAG: SURF1 family protein [Nocardioidaceae bacterium]|nr:SURF1 family protein [Nocardioidaceae bacterium]